MQCIASATSDTARLEIIRDIVLVAYMGPNTALSTWHDTMRELVAVAVCAGVETSAAAIATLRLCCNMDVSSCTTVVDAVQFPDMVARGVATPALGRDTCQLCLVLAARSWRYHPVLLRFVSSAETSCDYVRFLTELACNPANTALLPIVPLLMRCVCDPTYDLCYPRLALAYLRPDLLVAADVATSLTRQLKDSMVCHTLHPLSRHCTHTPLLHRNCTSTRGSGKSSTTCGCC